MSLKDAYNRIAQDWVKDHELDTWWQAGTDKFCSFVKKGGHILDVGCAGGMKSQYLINKGFSVIGIDISENMVEIARQKVEKAKFFVKDITRDFKIDEMFDGVFMQAVLLHVPKNQAYQVLKNITSALNPDGYLYIAVKQLREGQQEEEVVKENDYGYDYERFFSFYRLSELEKYIDDLHMTVIYKDVSSTGKTEWIQIIAKK